MTADRRSPRDRSDGSKCIAGVWVGNADAIGGAEAGSDASACASAVQRGPSVAWASRPPPLRRGSAAGVRSILRQQPGASTRYAGGGGVERLFAGRNVRWSNAPHVSIRGRTDRRPLDDRCRSAADLTRLTTTAIPQAAVTPDDRFAVFASLSGEAASAADRPDGRRSADASRHRGWIAPGRIARMGRLSSSRPLTRSVSLPSCCAICRTVRRRATFRTRTRRPRGTGRPMVAGSRIRARAISGCSPSMASRRASSRTSPTGARSAPSRGRATGSVSPSAG